MNGIRRCFNVTRNNFCLYSVTSNTSLTSSNLKKKLCVPNAAHNYSINADDIIDDNDRALQELDITLLKPHPEWRNVAAGPIWGKTNEYFELLWRPWLDEPSVKKFQISQDQDWKDYVEKFGETPLDYLKSDDYLNQYEDKDTWFNYVRNIKGAIQNQKTRKNCMKKGIIASGSPCSLCRDERLLLTYNNVPLLKQYIDHSTGELHSNLRTGLCINKQKRLAWTLTIAQELGFMHRLVPFEKFDLENYKINSYVL